MIDARTIGMLSFIVAFSTSAMFQTGAALAHDSYEAVRLRMMGAPPASAVDPQANTGAKIVASIHGRIPTAPTGGFLDLATSVVGASLNDDYEAAARTIGSLVDAGVACHEDRKDKCRFEKAGVVLDFGSGRHSLTLLPTEGFSNVPRLVAEENEGGILIRDTDAFAYVLSEEKSAIRTALTRQPEPTLENPAQK